MKNILSFQLFEQVYLNDVKPFDNNNKQPKGLRFVNRQEALKSVRRLQDMLTKKEIQLKDAIIAAYIISHRAEFHKYQNPGIKEGFIIWKEFLSELKKREKTTEVQVKPSPVPAQVTTGTTGSTGTSK